MRASLLLTLVALAMAAAPGRAAEPGSGEVLYRRYCASCHGAEGDGDGPAAGALCPRPTDLTQLDIEVPELMRLIDGRQKVMAHGTTAMPVWGEVFEESLLGEPHRRRTALLAVKTLAEYVRGLREPKSRKR